MNEHPTSELPEIEEEFKAPVTQNGDDKHDPVITAEYIADMLREMSELSSKANLVFLTYLIDIAHEEARIQARKARRTHI